MHAQIAAAPVAHFYETGARADGRLRWLFAACTDRLTFYSLHDKRGIDGLNHAGVLPTFTGIAVHDGSKPYRLYTQAQHALCNVHHLRELVGVIEPDLHDPQVVWAVRIDRLLRDLRSLGATGKIRAQALTGLDLAHTAAQRLRRHAEIARPHARSAGRSQLRHERRDQATQAGTSSDGASMDPRLPPYSVWLRTPD